MEMQRVKKCFFAVFFSLLFVCIIAILCDAIIIAMITFTIMFVSGLVYSSYSRKKNSEWLVAKMNEFLDSFTHLRNDAFPGAQVEKTAPLMKEKDYRQLNGWNYVFMGKSFLSEDVSFGKEKVERDNAGGVGTVRYDAVSRARAIKADTGKTYPLIKFRCNNMEGGGSDESYSVRFGDEVIDSRYTVTSDSELSANYIETLSCIVPSLKKASKYGISFSLFENNLFSYRFIGDTGYFRSYTENDQAVGETRLRELKEQLEVTKEMSDVL